MLAMMVADITNPFYHPLVRAVQDAAVQHRVFAASDTIAIGALEEAEALHLRVPEDVAIVGFDDIPEAQWVRPRLTTVAQNPSEMGRQLAEALFDRIETDPTLDRRVFEVPCRFIERETA